ncbi:cell envelope integrity EipB family protein [Chelatococcus sp. SYSU_G07232]|uniref:Cell envelope integrity EipB family protein n=1 Tax=Chelatococcus albus TaxID=3047466 RepID=A0ABT7ACU4_9HYPH|nr:cell envelope integrity EipB family protein [Chelatococcus sp. SYSU_G07232]MDJ1157206.1 cell envelope integrity EipB family protein [Chelatococcus sp. SYSU_G07232]
MKTTIAGGFALFAASLAAGAAAAATPVKLAPHRAVYDLTLLSSSGSRGVDSAKGRIAFDFTGDACEGYALSFRQVTVLQSGEIGERVSDLRTTSFEDGSGSSYKFKSESRFGTGATKQIDGEADRRSDGTVGVRLAKPKRDRLSVASDVLFPTAHMRKLIEAARAGETLLTARVYDGSDDGRKVFDTLAVIGRRIEGKTDLLEQVARKSDLDKLARWPVKISYFTPGEGERTPLYVMSFELFDNGISRDLTLDYGDFTLKGEMKQLDVLPASSCKR